MAAKKPEILIVSEGKRAKVKADLAESFGAVKQWHYPVYAFTVSSRNINEALAFLKSVDQNHPHAQKLWLWKTRVPP